MAKENDPSEDETPKPDAAHEASESAETESSRESEDKGVEAAVAEDAPDTDPEPDQRPMPEPVASEEKRGGLGFFSGLLLALVAAAIGFVAAFYVPRDYLPSWWPSIATAEQVDTRLAEERAALEEMISAQSGEIAALREQVQAAGGSSDETISALEGTVAELDQRVAGLAGDLGGVTEQLGTIGQTVSDLAARPVTGDATAASASLVADLQAEIEALRSQIDTVSAAPDAAAASQAAVEELRAELEQQLSANAELADRVAALADEASAVTEGATVRATLAQIESAIDRGVPFAAALDTLAADTGAEIPEALSASAETGVPTLATLEREFPIAARDALAESVKATMGDGAMDRVGAFLQSQLKPRSLEPQEGDSPDAILSRAEAAVKSGDIEAALSEIATLPEEGQAALSGWVAEATKRQAAADAAASLSQSLGN